MRSEDIDYESLSDLLIKVVPAIRTAYERELKWWKDEKPGQHIIFGDILVPHIAELVKDGKHAGDLRRIFDFLELLANHPDEHVQEVVHNSVCESICADEVMLQRLQKHLGEKTREFCRMILEDSDTNDSP